MPRRPLDQYETPPHYVAPLLAVIGPLDGLTVYEPCVGQGHIARYLTPEVCGCRHLCTNDLDPACPATLHEDARTEAAWPAYDPVEPWLIDWVITNPPFSDALPILQHALANAHNVAMLARLSFLEPTRSRAAFWCQHPPTDVIVLPRYSFRCNDAGKRQTDSVTCCWLIFQEGRSQAGRPGCLTFSTERGGAPC
jgi:hypothetical protein